MNGDARRDGAAALLRARSVTKRYGKFTAVRDVTLDVVEGTIHSVIGPNGAGKTTLFHVLTGSVRLTSGSIVFDGEDISRLPGHRRVHRGLARSFQVTTLFPQLSVRENLRVAAQGRRARQALALWRRAESLIDASELAEELSSKLHLDSVMSRPAGALSHGQQRRLEVGMAMAAQPKLILLDEPTSGMGIDDIEQMRRLIHALRRDGRTVLLIEHNMGIVMDISDTITVMQQGEVLVEGRPEEIRTDARVRQAYLGGMAQEKRR